MEHLSAPLVFAYDDEFGCFGEVGAKAVEKRVAVGLVDDRHLPVRFPFPRSLLGRALARTTADDLKSLEEGVPNVQDVSVG